MDAVIRFAPGVSRREYARTHGYQGRVYGYDPKRKRRVIVASRFYAAATYGGWRAARTLAELWAVGAVKKLSTGTRRH